MPESILSTPTLSSTSESIFVPLSASPIPLDTTKREHIVAPGDTLYGISLNYGLSIESILALNTLLNPDLLEVGQVIQLPQEPREQTPAEKLFADTNIVRSVESAAFDVDNFIQSQAGFIRLAKDKVALRLADGSVLDETLSASEIIKRVSLEFSVNPRLLLALLEYRAGWLSSNQISDAKRTNPLISEEDSIFDRAGLYKQLSWAANEINRGYYSAKYGKSGFLEFKDGNRLSFAPGLNAGTISLQRFLSLFQFTQQWQQDVSSNGFQETYKFYFGDPTIENVTAQIPEILNQPTLTLPFSEGEVWFYTGGPHGGWGDGSAWAAIDLVPPDIRPMGSPLCYQSNTALRSVADGMIVRSGRGAVILDLDGDGDESTGWTILYLHIASNNRVPEGTFVKVGDIIGYPSCEGGFSTATHVHIARRYNGEWIPADDLHSAFTMSNWVVVGIEGQEYQGYMIRDSVQMIAEQSRELPINHISR
ncbi:hypothetical protein MASR2M15_21370 [Anaerolineales bacterium]